MIKADRSATAEVRIEEYQADWVRLPLRRPYNVAYRPIETFEVFITTARFSDGSVGYGEACPVAGYTEDTPESIWSGLRTHIPDLRGLNGETVRRRLEERLADEPFLMTALMSPLEWSDAIEQCPDVVTIPLLGTVLGETPTQTKSDVEELLGAGYRTLKVKVGWNVDDDLAHVRIVQDAIRYSMQTRRHPDEPRIRIDANQAYSFEQARAFLDNLDPSFIELFEQPIGDERWDLMERIGDSPVPLMLDEWIKDERSVLKAAVIPAVDFVKLKLMKAGGFSRLAKLVGAARDAGLGVILGNGVASDVGCISEAIATWRLSLTSAGEMNGFLKPHQCLTSALTVRDGNLIAHPKGLALNETVVQHTLVDRIFSHPS